MRHLLLGSAAAATLFFAMGTSAFAQAATEAKSDAGAEVIIVTAQKRVQNVQEVAAAVSVIGGEQIARAGGYNIESVQTQIPTLNFRKGGTNLNSSLFLRGVGTINFSIAAEPSVAVVLDGVVLARAGEAFGDLSDIQRIEVLRGPQGTLFGKNSSAGVVNIISQSPGRVHSGDIQVTANDGNEYKLRASVDMPFSDSVRSRVTVFGGSYDGNITNLTTGSKINGYERYGVRGILDIDASESLKVRLIGDYRKADDNCCGEVIGTAPTGANAAALLSLLPGITFAGDETRVVRNNLVTRTEEESWGVSAQADWDAGDFTVTSITAYRGWDNREVREGDWLDRPAAYVGNGFAQLHDDGPQTSTTFSQELRLTSPTGKPLEYVVGAYFSNAETERDFRRDVIVCSASTLAIDTTGQRPCSTATGVSTFVTAFSSANFGSESRNAALFADGSYKATERLSIVGGVRVTQDKLSYYHNRVPAPIGGLPGLRNDTSGFKGSTKEDNVSGKLGLKYQASDDINFYLTQSRGYKGPAYNVFFNMNTTGLNAIAPETVDSTEGGVKTAFMDNRVILNFAVFRAVYENFQANNFDTLNGVVITRLTNAGNVSTTGLELDWLIRADGGLTINGGLAVTDAQIEEFRDANLVLSSTRRGERLALSPRFKASLGANYEWEPEAVPGIIHLNGQVSYSSDQFSDIGENPLLRIPETTIVDASIGISDKQDRYRLTLNIKNLTDEKYASLVTPGGPGGSLRYLIPRDADRYVGLTLRAKFGG
ncbi:MAG: TonB-dependent receptor [Aquidulcibacter sp.]|jgi:iron complex outermembrane receptor protein|uniref:TonB-dependent receptor n=1 Tax=Aquidulcibacter sp. TaxID=2052990 RepID=UPI0022C09FE6|nr:TonB-dependent receptor [Aquidulcibacter sp.]MCE2890973.1 TonB-dependent receptor [Hyphomonadaceae bacterium]MCZ8206902.1 TonB-dependent receptor [Aquidulcibacter sp.]